MYKFYNKPIRWSEYSSTFKGFEADTKKLVAIKLIETDNFEKEHDIKK